MCFPGTGSRNSRIMNRRARHGTDRQHATTQHGTDRLVSTRAELTPTQAVTIQHGTDPTRNGPRRSNTQNKQHGTDRREPTRTAAVQHGPQRFNTQCQHGLPTRATMDPTRAATTQHGNPLFLTLQRHAVPLTVLRKTPDSLLNVLFS